MCIYMSVCLCLFLCMCVHVRVSVMAQNHPNRPLIVSTFKKQHAAAWPGRICQLDASVSEPFLRRTCPALPNCHSADRTWSLPLPLVYFCILISFHSSCCQGLPPPSWSKKKISYHCSSLSILFQQGSWLSFPRPTIGPNYTSLCGNA